MIDDTGHSRWFTMEIVWLSIVRRPVNGRLACRSGETLEPTPNYPCNRSSFGILAIGTLPYELLSLWAFFTTSAGKT